MKTRPFTDKLKQRAVILADTLEEINSGQSDEDTVHEAIDLIQWLTVKLNEQRYHLELSLRQENL